MMGGVVIERETIARRWGSGGRASAAAVGLAIALLMLSVATAAHAQSGPGGAPPPEADAGGPYEVPAGAILELDASASFDVDGDALRFTWDLGDGSTEIGERPTHVYRSPGVYTVTLTASDSEGLSDIDVTEVHVVAAPTAEAGGPYSANPGESIQFDGTGSTDDGTGSLTYFWEFGDGASDTGPTPSHTYASGGTYTVTLTVTDGLDQQATDTAQARINRAPTADAGGPYSGNVGQQIGFDGSGTDDPDGDLLTFAWQFGDGDGAGGQSPSHSYGSGGDFTVTLTVTDAGGLESTATSSADINAGPTADAGPEKSGNPGESITFDGSGSSDPEGDVLTFSWNFGDGSNGSGVFPQHSYASGGTYTVTLTLSDPGGLTDVSTTSAEVNSGPTADAGGPYFANPGENVTFDGTGSSDPDGGNLTYAWDFGDGLSGSGPTPSHSYVIGGTYDVRLTVTDDSDLSDQDTTEARINRPPNADAGGPYDAEAGQQVQFDGGGSSDPGGGNLTFAWNFGDGSNGSGESPSHVYATGGTYTVTLTVTDTGGLTDSDGTEARINAPPIADAGGPYSANAGQLLSFDGSASSDPDGGNLNYAWDFGDGANGSGVNPAHVYAVGGTYRVTLTVTDDSGASDSDGVDVLINSGPTADAGGPYQVNLGESLQFDGSGSSDPGGDTLTYNWDFGDGSIGSGVSPSHTYAAAGSYTVRLGVIDAGGLSDADESSVTVNGPPVADAGGPYAGAINETIDFDGSGSSDPEGANLAFIWEFGDGHSRNGENVTHKYMDGGVYNVTLTVRDPRDLESSATTTATINSPPDADAGGPYAGNEGVSIQFDGSGSSDPEGDSLSYTWDFGDGQTTGGVSPTHSYVQGDEYLVTLTVSDGVSSSSAGTSAIINGAPRAEANGPYGGNAGELIQFSSSGSTDEEDGTNLDFLWDFGDGSTSTDRNPQYAFQASQEPTRTVTLRVTDSGGLSHEDDATVSINRAPSADAGGPYTGNEGEPVDFNGTGSSDPDGDDLTFLWQFGDGSTATGPTPSHVYEGGLAGTFTVTLTVTDTGDLESFASTTMLLNRSPSADAGGPYSVDRDATLRFDGSGSDDPDGDNLIFEWQFGDGGVAASPGLDDPQHVYESGGAYTVTLTVRDRQRDGLVDVDATTVTVNDIVVTNPDGGDAWAEGSTHNIRWDVTGAIGDVRIEYRLSPVSSWRVIADDINGADEVFSWSPIPNVEQDRPQAQVRVRRSQGGGNQLAGLSDTFLIENRRIVVDMPDSGDELFETQEIEIRWQSFAVVGTVDIWFLPGGSSERIRVANGVPSESGRFEWIVPEVATDRLDSRIEIVTADGETTGRSGAFDVLDRSLRVSSPDGADVWSEADTRSIEWQAVGPLGQVILEYQVPGVGPVEITRRPATTEEYDWTLPDVAADTPGVRVLIRQANPGTDEESDQSDAFTIQNRVIEVTAPVEGLTASERTDVEIEWNSVGFVEEVEIEYSMNDGVSWSTIDGSVPNADGANSFTWETPEIDTDQTVLVRVKDSNGRADDASDVSAPIELIDRVIMLSTPTLGASVCESDTATITWTSAGFVPDVDIHWRRSSRDDWKVIATDIPNTGTFVWSTPDVESTAEEARVRIRHTGEGDLVIGFSEPFTITDRELTLLNPREGDELTEGQGVLLSWDQVCVDSVAVAVRLSDETPWIPQGTWEASQTQIFWPVPPVEQNTSGVRLRVADASDPNVESVSGPFMILNKTLNLIAPTVNDSLSEAQTVSIRWDWEGELSRVDLAFRYTDDGTWQTIAQNVVNTGSFAWTVPLVAADREAQVRVKDTFSQLEDEGLPFGIINRSLAIVAPEAGAIISEATTTSVVWETRGVVPIVRIEFRQSEANAWQAIVADLPNEDRYEWQVVNVTGDQAAAQVRVIDIAASDVVAESAAFTIIDRTFSIASPTAGDEWSELSAQSITWTSTGEVDSVAIDYRLTPESDWLPVVASTPNIGEYAWMLPSVDERFADAAVRVADLTDPGSAQRVSDFYTIVDRTIALVNPAPSPRVAWLIGSTQTIEWNTTGDVPLVDVAVSRTGDEGPFDSLTRGIANTGTFDWIVDGSETYDAVVQVTSSAGDVIGGSAFPVALFDLVPPELCGDFNHDSVVDLDEVMYLEGLIVGRFESALVDSTNLDCHDDATLDLNDLLGSVDSFLADASEGRGRTADGRFVDAGTDADLILRIGQVANASGQARVAIELDGVSMPVEGFLVELEVTGADIAPVRLTENGDVALLSTRVRGTDRWIVSARRSWSRDVPSGVPVAMQLDAAPFGIDVMPTHTGEMRVRLVRAEAYGENLEPLSIHLDGDTAPLAPTAVLLAQNAPNPFNPSTLIRFGLPELTRVRLTIYDVNGRLVRRVVDESLPAGFHAVRWDGRDERGVDVASGVYLYALDASGARELRKMTLIR